MTLPQLHAGPAVGWEQPFEMLLACHQRVERMLGLMERLATHVAAHGVDGNARQAAQDVMRYFDLAGPAHHEDEERHLFPRLAAAGGAAAVLAARLHDEHQEMSRQWALVRSTLARVATGEAADSSAWADFAALYRSHIQAEEGQAYPEARTLVDDAALQAMGAEMARRRGAR